jgi:hypothetical protein
MITDTEIIANSITTRTDQKGALLATSQAAYYPEIIILSRANSSDTAFPVAICSALSRSASTLVEILI